MSLNGLYLSSFQSSGLKRDWKGNKKDLKVIVIGNNEKQNGELSDTVPNSTEVDGDWMLGITFEFIDLISSLLIQNGPEKILLETINYFVVNSIFCEPPVFSITSCIFLHFFCYVDGLGTDEEGRDDDELFVTSQSKKTPPSGSKYTLTCHLCDDEFALVSAFRRHYFDEHPGIKPFSCVVCSKRFDRKENLIRHIRIHTGDRRYICNFCSKGYTDPSGLKKHVVSKHSGTKFTCDMCQAIFSSKDGYTKHLSKHLRNISGCEEKKIHTELHTGTVSQPTSPSPESLLLESTHKENEEHATIEVLMEKAPEEEGEEEKEEEEEDNIKPEIITKTDSVACIKEQPIQNVVQQLQQFVDEQVSVQYVQVTTDASSSSEQTDPLCQNNDIEPSVQDKPYLFNDTASREHHFVIPITAPQLLSITSNEKGNTGFK